MLKCGTEAKQAHKKQSSSAVFRSGQLTGLPRLLKTQLPRRSFSHAEKKEKNGPRALARGAGGMNNKTYIGGGEKPAGVFFFAIFFCECFLVARRYYF